MKLVLGSEGGVFWLLQLPLGSVCESGAVGDTRRHGQDSHLRVWERELPSNVW